MPYSSSKPSVWFLAKLTNTWKSKIDIERNNENNIKARIIFVTVDKHTHGCTVIVNSKRLQRFLFEKIRTIEINDRPRLEWFGLSSNPQCVTLLYFLPLNGRVQTTEYVAAVLETEIDWTNNIQYDKHSNVQKCKKHFYQQGIN